MEDLLHPRKKARTEMIGLQASTSTLPPAAPASTSSNPSGSSTGRQIHSVVYAGYEIQARFSAPYPWDDLVKETRSPGGVPGGSRSRPRRESGQGKNRDGQERFGKRSKTREDALGEENGKNSSQLDEHDSLSSLSSSSSDVEDDEYGIKGSRRRRSRTKSARVREHSRGQSINSSKSNEIRASPAQVPADDIASFSTFPPPPPSPPLPVHSVEDELPPPSPPPLPRSQPATGPASSNGLKVILPIPEVESKPPFASDTSSSAPDSTTVPPQSPRVPQPLPIASTSAPKAPTPIPAAEVAATKGANMKRSKGGRFLPKPQGTTVKAQRALARQARALESADAPSALKTLTQRELREIKRKEKEQKEREQREKEGTGKEDEEERQLWICDRCFKYMADLQGWKVHQKECEMTHPPGRRVYQRGATSIWEVDGATAKLYCQNLCLFAKLFIEHKYMFFDVEAFSFYLLTEATAKQEWVLGYFSKEKISYDDYNLACIVVFPPFRQKGWATLLIEFSYELSRRLSRTPGTPERPLSELGQAGYLAHWTSVLVRYFRSIFTSHVEPPYIDDVIAEAQALQLRDHREAENGGGDGQSPESAAKAKAHRRNYLKRTKGWVGEQPLGAGILLIGQHSAFTLRATKEGEVSGRVDEAGEFDFGPFTDLTTLSEKLNLQVEDVAWALVESGLAQWRTKGLESEGESGEAEEELMIVVTPELVEAVAEKKKVKKMPMLDVAYVCM
ncbi:uncharacterized protein JCM15063_006253 [Sporobolomyces koalae]|uniref:uncharacterized protein n=1 Tax=Sporobolomyces koalae TaxID=500713 RepID=UPI003173FBDA